MTNTDKAPWGYDEDYKPYTKSRFKRLGKDRKIEAMVSWFKANYEGPEQRTPRDSGDWVWIYGGPFEASDEIQGNFGGEVDYELMKTAIDVIEEDGWEWTRTEQPGDYGEFEMDFESEPTREEVQADLEKRIVALEEVLGAPPPPLNHGGMGHNKPPEEMGLENVNASQAEMEALIGSVREEIKGLRSEIQKTTVEALQPLKNHFEMAG